MFLFKQLKLVIVVRADLKLSKGKTASQASHAAVICYKKSIDAKSSLAEKWFKLGQPKIVLKVDSLTDLENLESQAKSAGIISAVVCDAGRTHIAPGTTTCIGLGPDYDDKIDALVKDLKLL